MNQTDGIEILYSTILITVSLALRKTFRRIGHVARMEDMRNENKISVKKCEAKRPGI